MVYFLQVYLSTDTNTKLYTTIFLILNIGCMQHLWDVVYLPVLKYTFVYRMLSMYY